jgi:hypothetical protein
MNCAGAIIPPAHLLPSPGFLACRRENEEAARKKDHSQGSDGYNPLHAGRRCGPGLVNPFMGGWFMKRIVEGMLVLGLAALVAVPLLAQEAKKPGKKAADPYAGLFTFGKKITADDKQKEKLAALKTEYAPKLAELDKKMAVILPPDRMKAAREAQKKASETVKDKKELNKVFMDALKLTPEEQKELKPINKARGELLKEINDKKTALLTAEQKEALKPKKKDK